MKVCKKCGVAKALTEFYKCATGVLGLRGECKACTKEVQKVYNRNHRAQIDARIKEWEKSNPNKRNQYARAWVERNPAKRKEVLARYNKSDQCKTNKKLNSLKLQARGAVSRAVIAGRLVRGCCAVCGCCPAEGHHHKGYEEQFWLDVVWFCRKHHREADKAQGVA